MIKYQSISIALCLVLSACSQEKVLSDTLNFDTIIDEEQLLLGHVNRDGFKLPNYQNWFDSTYQVYAVKSETLPAIKTELEGVEIKAFIATWCSDTQREIPALYKILDELKFNEDHLTLVAVDRTKALPKDLVAGYEIEYVPTLIFSKDQKEIGRIVEAPNQSLEEDILAILNK